MATFISRLSLRWRITIPFLLLALLIVTGITFLALRLLRESDEERFLRQLANSGQLASDSAVRAESELLESERLVANTDGLSQALSQADAEQLRSLVLPLAVNTELDAVMVLDERGVSQLAARHLPSGGAGSYETVKGEAIYTDWPVVRSVLASASGSTNPGKQLGLSLLLVEDRFLVTMIVAGPVQDPSGAVIGAVAVGEYADSLVDRMALASGANVTLYDSVNGDMLATSLDLDPSVGLMLPADWRTQALVARSDTPVRSVAIAGAPYREALIELSGDPDSGSLAIMGVSLLDSVGAPGSAESDSGARTSILWVIGLGAAGLLLVGLAGLLISQSISGPLAAMADASARVASGDLDVTLPEAGGGEMATLARSFNRMILGLRSVEQPADLLSTRLPAPPRLEPEAETSPVNETSTCQVAVLAISAAPTESLVPGVDSVAERAQAVMEALGSAVQAHRGQLLQFDGVDALAVFGGPPRRQPMQVSALLAMHAAFSVIDNLRRLDVKLRSGGGVGIEPRVAVHGGPIDFGEIGGEYGLPTLAVGATLGAAKSLLGPAARVPTGSVLASDVVVNSLSAGRSQFAIGRKGRVAARELNQEFVVHEVQDRRMTLTKSRNSQA